MIDLDRISDISLEQYLSQRADRIDVPRLVICTSGYESRCVFFTTTLVESHSVDEATEFFVLGFSTFSDQPTRQQNDSYYNSIGVPVYSVGTSDATGIVDLVAEKIKEALKKSPDLEVHIDYSSMPRAWYCSLVLSTVQLVGLSKAFFWYTPGLYPSQEVASAGIRDFSLFSGEPTIGSTYRTHVFGLGFDTIRSEAIWSVIDPKRFICYYAEPGVQPEDGERVRSANANLLKMAADIVQVPIFSFVDTISKLREYVMVARNRGDVILVPDGPKPLILAASLIPDSFEEDGIVCFHVGRHHPPSSDMAIKPSGIFTGFCYYHSTENREMNAAL